MLKATIDRFEGEYAVLVFDDGQVINWPQKKLPEDTKEGSVVWLSILIDQKQTKKQKELAKEILNEILKPDSKE